MTRLIMPVLLLVNAVALQAGGPQATTSKSTYSLPQPQKVSLARPVDCRPVATSFMSEKGGQLTLESSVGTDHLTIVRSGSKLKVTAHHENSSIADDVDVYTITAETVDFLSAVQAVKMIPVVHGFVINKRLGSAVWSESDATFVLVSDYPVSSSVFLRCSN
jgi:hypothetical protein